MQVFVSGTWQADKARPYGDQATELGKRIASAGFDLACGPGTGIARYVIDGYRSVPDRGRVRYYLPSEEDMLAVGEEVLHGADEIEHTGFDYPMRNVFQIMRSDGLFVLTGGDGTLEEILPAVIDYRLPVAIVDGAGSAAVAVTALLRVYPAWGELVSIGPDVGSLVGAFLQRVASQRTRRRSGARTRGPS